MPLPFRYPPAAVCPFPVSFMWTSWLLLTPPLKCWCFSSLFLEILSMFDPLLRFYSFSPSESSTSHSIPKVITSQNRICLYFIKPTSLSKFCLLSPTFTKQHKFIMKFIFNFSMKFIPNSVFPPHRLLPTDLPCAHSPVPGPTYQYLPGEFPCFITSFFLIPKA